MERLQKSRRFQKKAKSTSYDGTEKNVRVGVNSMDDSSGMASNWCNIFCHAIMRVFRNKYTRKGLKNKDFKTEKYHFKKRWKNIVTFRSIFGECRLSRSEF